MNKSLAIKLATALVVALVVYSVFWFFKLGQLEKRVNKFVTENAAHVSIGEISVSGFPFSQKITIKDFKFNIPTPALDKRQVVVKHIEAVAGIFASEFVVTLPEPVVVQDAEGMIANVEFNTAPEIMTTLDEGRILKLSYKDSGYRILDDKKIVIYAASSSVVNVESSFGEGDKIITKINVDIKDIEGFAILDIYKNALEKDIMNGLKTGEIAIGSASTALIPAQLDIASATGQAALTPATAVESSAPVSEVALPNVTALEVVANPTEAAAILPNPEAVIKSNFLLSAEYVLAPNHIEQQPMLDPTKIQEAPLQYTKTFNIVNLKFSNSLYDLTINGEMTALPDDSTPSGGLSIKVTNIDNLIKNVTDGLNQMMEKSKPSDMNIAADLIASNHHAGVDPYNDFLKKISGNLGNVAKEMAAKNAVSKESIAQFDIRREKNLDFIINEIPLREVLGKF